MDVSSISLKMRRGSAATSEVQGKRLTSQNMRTMMTSHNREIAEQWVNGTIMKRFGFFHHFELRVLSAVIEWAGMMSAGQEWSLGGIPTIRSTRKLDCRLLNIPVEV